MKSNFGTLPVAYSTPARQLVSLADSTSLGCAIYRRFLDRERDADRRYLRLGGPRMLLEALEAGETVQVPSWRVPVDLRPPGCGSTLVVTPDT
jgi:hypothetical protein